MKAGYFDGDQLTLRNDITTPEHESLIQVNLAGICGTDLEILDGYMDYCGVLGHEFVGTLKKSSDSNLVGKRAVGEINAGCNRCHQCQDGMSRHCPNRTVLGILNRNGAFAEYLSLPERNLHVIPDTISDRQAVFVEPLAAAFEICEQIQIQQNWNVAVVGDGRLAQLVSRVLKLSCSEIVCFGRHQNKLTLAEKNGIKTRMMIEPKDHAFFDMVVEATGSNSGFIDSIKLVKPRGTIMLKSTIASKENLDLTPVVVNEVSIIGSRCGVFKPAIDALATGTIQVDDLIDSTYSLHDIHAALEHAKRPDALKILLKP